MAKRIYILDEPEETMAMFKADHQRVRDLFQHYEHTCDPHLRQQMAAHVLVALELYALVEETVFYPAFAEETEKKEAVLGQEAPEEHQRIRELIAALRTCDPEDVACDPRFQELMDAVSQHV
jgi:selenocysteine lyase/cysteine desulfurase